jgi:hypothetical protein
VYTQYANSWSYQIVNRNDRSVNLENTMLDKNKKEAVLSKVAVVAVDRLGNESERTEVEIGL